MPRRFMPEVDHMALVPQNKPRRVYITEDQWRAIKSYCAEHGSNVSSWVRSMIDHVIDNPIVEHEGKPVVLVPLVSHDKKIALPPKKP